MNFTFANLCGTVYRQGNVVFTPDGNSLLSPVGNKVTVFDLASSRATTLPFELRKNISRLALSPRHNGALLLSIDEDGRAVLCNVPRRVELHRFNFGGKVTDIKFSPDGKLFACAIGRRLEVWRSPGFHREFAPFVLVERYMGHHNDDITCVTWSPDSQFIATGCKDSTAKLIYVGAKAARKMAGRSSNADDESNNNADGNDSSASTALPPHKLKRAGVQDKPVVMVGHRDAVTAIFFAADQRALYTVSRDGALCVRELRRRADGEEEHAPSYILGEVLESPEADADADNEEDENESTRVRDPSELWWRTVRRHYFSIGNGAKLSSCTFHAPSQMVYAGFTNGVFGLWELPAFTNIQTLSMAQHPVDTAAVNNTGEWLALGSTALGQLLVWEWQSETYVLKQQGHFHSMATLAYSPDAQRMVTGGNDGKVKAWDASTGFCFVTFTEHTAAVTAVQFAPNKAQVVVSASMDGTVRAFDLVRYRNFRTLTSPSPVQFASLAIDPAGDIVCAGTRDSFEIYVWSLQTGKLLDVLGGHEGPVSSLAFDPAGLVLTSGSWDYTVKRWDVFGRSHSVETYQHTHEVLALAYRPDGRELCTATLDGHLHFWEIDSAREVGIIEARRDISGGRRAADRTTAQNTAAGKAFNTLSYSADGRCVLAGGSSKYICLYEVSGKALLRRIEVSRNLTLDGTQEMLDSRMMTEAGPRGDLGSDSEDDSDYDGRGKGDKTLPGAQSGDLSARSKRPPVRTTALQFAPTGRAWAAATTEGLLVYALDDNLMFDPFELDEEVTPEAVEAAIRAKDQHLRALVLALRLNEPAIMRRAFASIPAEAVPLVSRSFPTRYLSQLLTLLAASLSESPALELHLQWVVALLFDHSNYIKSTKGSLRPELRQLQKAIVTLQEALSGVCTDNVYYLRYLTTRAESTLKENENAAAQELNAMELN
ncbi:putative WD repeat protein [Ramicandelaber brevisporus]|nr:putative WD repeat protein [Ramicandelaber brevisporus]